MSELEQARAEKLQRMAARSGQGSGRIALKVVDLHKSFGSKQVLKGVDLEVEEGSTTVIIGSSGCGKSVLVKHLIGLLRPDSGEVWVGDQEISSMRPRQLDEVRKRFGMCFQLAALFDSMTVEENVAFPLVEHTKMSLEEIRERVREVLALVELHDVEEMDPAALSGGMRKRVGLARAVVLGPEILIYDEPTTGLDPILTEEVDNLILDTQEKLNVTSVVISHDVGSVFRIADKVAMIADGRIVASGTPAEMLANESPEVRRFLTTFG